MPAFLYFKDIPILMERNPVSCKSTKKIQKFSGWSHTLSRISTSPKKQGNHYAASLILMTLFLLGFLSWAFILIGLSHVNSTVLLLDDSLHIYSYSIKKRIVGSRLLPHPRNYPIIILVLFFGNYLLSPEQ